MLVYQTHEANCQITRISGTFSFYSHIHKQIELCYCRRGRMTVTCKGQVYDMTPGSWMIVLPDTEHSYLSGSELEAYILIVNSMLIPNLSSYLNRSLLTPVVQDAQGDAARYLEDLAVRAEKPCPDTIYKGFLYLILGFLFERCRFAEPPAGSGTDLCCAVLEYLSENFKSAVSLQELARRFGVNASYLSRAFHKKIGCGICEVLYGYRVDYAKYLLLNTDRPVTDICFESGFSTQRSFNRWFSRLEHRSPTVYRRSQRSQ